MEIKERIIKGLFEITLNPINDKRGYFTRTFDIDEFAKYGLNQVWVQENHSMTKKKYVIRGLHFQFPPYAESKLVRCIRGAIMDVFVDLREKSETFGCWDFIELSAENMKMVFIPRGFAHGFCTLTEESEVLYKVDNFYAPDYECGLLWNDSDIGIEWPCNNPELSEKDKSNMGLKDFISKHNGIKINSR